MSGLFFFKIVVFSVSDEVKIPKQRENIYTNKDLMMEKYEG